MRRIKLTLDYIGTNYCGWQRQVGLDTVQMRVENAIKNLTGETVSIVGSGRTDAGVHAIGAVAHFDTERALPVKNFTTGLNHFLPPDIRILKSEEVDENFHARFSAVEKTYCYIIYCSKTDRAIYHNRAVRVEDELDIDLMKKASSAFIGEKDFRSFMSTGADTKTTVRTVKEINIEKTGDLIKIHYTANGFLYNMVRLMTGVLIRAGRGAIDGSDIEKLLEQKSKNAVNLVMPAHGLYLVEVKY